MNAGESVEKAIDDLRARVEALAAKPTKAAAAPAAPPPIVPPVPPKEA